MRITILSDGRVFEGTAEQIVRQMQSLSFVQEGRSLADYIDWLQGQVARTERIALEIDGTTDAEKAKALVSAMLDAGLAKRT